jgi:hypothetical protein
VQHRTASVAIHRRGQGDAPGQPISGKSSMPVGTRPARMCRGH